MSSYAKDDGNNCTKVYAVQEGYSQGVVIVVRVSRHPKAIGVLTLPSVESLRNIASASLTCFGVLTDVMF
jgi:hypothetical protein